METLCVSEMLSAFESAQRENSEQQHCYSHAVFAIEECHLRLIGVSFTLVKRQFTVKQMGLVRILNRKYELGDVGHSASQREY
jgi:hypothetical protein